MLTENWLPIGFALPDGTLCGKAWKGGPDWQIVVSADGGSVLLAHPELAARWLATGLLDQEALHSFGFGARAYCAIASGAGPLLAPALDCRSPRSEAEAMAFALALHATRCADPVTSLADAIYVEELKCLLPTYASAEPIGDDVVLGAWLTGGARVSAQRFRQLSHMLSWLAPQALQAVVAAAGLTPVAGQPLLAPVSAGGAATAAPRAHNTAAEPAMLGNGPFHLAGRPQLEAFFNEHVVDIIANQARYAALGIGFPAAVILHGPPGCGKTYAVEQLIDYLGWPSFQIDASSIASPYIHETSKKVAEVFETAMQHAPSVLVIDEMEAFLADRSMGGGGSHHRVEEVAEFLRRIPEATANRVLIVAMTNRIDMIDAAIMRRGRFDHVIKVDYASAEEVLALLEKLLLTLPRDETVELAPLARRLAGRPLSDVAYMVREGARRAAKAGADHIGQAYLLAALDDAPARDETPARGIGFV